MKFITKNGFFGILLIGSQSRLSFHMSQDPRRGFYGIAGSRPVATDFLQAWWVAGKPVASRIERSFKKYFKGRRDANGLFDANHDEASAFIEKTAQNMGTWTASENDMVHLMDLIERRKENTPADAPTLLAGLTGLPPLDSPSVLKHFEDGFMRRVA